MKKKPITQNDDLIAQGLAKKLIRISDDGKRIEYLCHGISRDWTKPEASVEAKAYLTLVLQYGYPYDRIRLFAPVTIGSSLREADIEVYADAKHETPIIIVECKKEEVSEAEFRQAVEQAFSYAVSEGAKYVWTTSGIKNEYYEVPDKKPKARKTVADIPRFGSMYISEYRYGVNGGLNRHCNRLKVLQRVVFAVYTAFQKGKKRGTMWLASSPVPFPILPRACPAQTSRSDRGEIWNGVCHGLNQSVTAFVEK